MRPTIFGRQIVYDKQGVFVGLNLGYNFFVEHECGTQGLVERVNRDKSVILTELKKEEEQGVSTFKLKRKLDKLLKEDLKELKRWDKTPFKDYVLNKHIPMFSKKITINNEEIQNKYNKFLLDNDDYTMLVVGSGYYIKCLKDKFGKKRIFNEKEIFYMEDYNDSVINNVGYMLSRNKISKCMSNNDFAGQWDPNGFMILSKKDIIIENIEDAIKRSCLAVVPEEPRLFNDRGCCLIILDRAYGV